MISAFLGHFTVPGTLSWGERREAGREGRGFYVSRTVSRVRAVEVVECAQTKVRSCIVVLLNSHSVACTAATFFFLSRVLVCLLRAVSVLCESSQVGRAAPTIQLIGAQGKQTKLHCPPPERTDWYRRD